MPKTDNPNVKVRKIRAYRSYASTAQTILFAEEDSFQSRITGVVKMLETSTHLSIQVGQRDN